MVESWMVEDKCQGTLTHEQRRENYRLLHKYHDLSLEKKIEMSKKVIRLGIETSMNSMVACSFGKDSIVTLYLLLEQDKNIKVVYNNTGVEFRETLNFAKQLISEWNLNYVELHPKTFEAKDGEVKRATFWNIAREYGFPPESREGTYAPCCYFMKEKPLVDFIKGKDALIFTGFTIDEGHNRRIAFIRKGGFIYPVKKWNCFRAVPLLFWDESDIWKFIEQESLPVNPVYKKYNIPRQGCMWCTGHKGWEQQILKVNPRVYEYIQKMKGQYLLTNIIDNRKR